MEDKLKKVFNMSAYEETKRLTKILFNELYAREFKSRIDFDYVVTSIIRNNKRDGVKYSYNSLYFINDNHRDFMFHVTVTAEGCYSVTTFSFNMIWDDSGFQNKFNTDNISIYEGTPGYWFTSVDNRPYVEEEYRIEI